MKNEQAELVEALIPVIVKASRSEGEEGDPIEQWEITLAENIAAAVLAAVTPQIEARVVGEIVAWLRFGLDDWPDYVAPPDIADAIERGDYKDNQP